MKPTPLTELINLTGKTAIVTGGALGIGYGIAYRLLEAGASVVIADINAQATDAACAAFSDAGYTATGVAADVSNESDVQRVVGTAMSAYGGVDILVNNAGIYPTIPVMQMEVADFDRVIDTNLRSVFLLTKVAGRVMIDQGRGGKIINITSIDALHPSSVGLAVYDASKHGLWGFTKNTALELAPHNIQVNAIAPGGIATPGTGAGTSVTPEMEEILSRFLAKIPMKRMGEADEIGTAAFFLASGLSQYMTGSQIVVDGGVLLA